MRRFDGYNREDYYFPKSCKEAFGSEFEIEEKSLSKTESVVAIAIVCSIIIMSCLVSSFL
jgi:hypothetical protein